MRRLVAAALHDIITPETLFQGVTKVLGQNEASHLYQPDRSAGSSLNTASIKHLTAMSHREYIYGEDGFESILLRQQTNLGDGLSIQGIKLRKPGAVTAFKLPILLAKGGSTTVTTDEKGQAVPAASASAAASAARAVRLAARTTAAADSAGAAAGAAAADGAGATAAAANAGATAAVDGVGAAAADGAGATAAAGAGATAAGSASGGATAAKLAKLPIANDKKGREQKEGARAAAALRRKESAKQKEAAASAAYLLRCEQSSAFHCNCDPRGSVTCNRVFDAAWKLESHLKSGKHREGAKRPFMSGVTPGRGTAHDRNIALVGQALTKVLAPRSEIDGPDIQLMAITEFNVCYADGERYEQERPSAGWARAQRLPTELSTFKQIEFVWRVYEHGINHPLQKLSSHSAHDIMKRIGNDSTIATVSRSLLLLLLLLLSPPFFLLLLLLLPAAAETVAAADGCLTRLSLAALCRKRLPQPERGQAALWTQRGARRVEAQRLLWQVGHLSEEALRERSSARYGRRGRGGG